MSVIGEKAAVVSLGMSCQSGEQIRNHADLLARLAGDPTMRIATSVFDNIICTPGSAARMLQADTFYPNDPAALTVSQGAYWKDLGVYFWHEYRLHKHHVLEYLFGRVNTRRAFRDLSGKYAHLAARFPDQISGGEQQRTAIARAVVHRPALIIADEPTGNLDRATGHEVVALFERCVRAAGAALLMATHSEEMLGHADRVLELRDGRLHPHP